MADVADATTGAAGTTGVEAGAPPGVEVLVILGVVNETTRVAGATADTAENAGAEVMPTGWLITRGGV